MCSDAISETREGIPSAPAASAPAASAPAVSDLVDLPERRRGIVARLLLALIALYRKFLSPILPPRCRFYPTCSSYAVTAIERFGAGRGSWLAIRRVSKCHPLHPGGIDPVPERTGD